MEKNELNRFCLLDVGSTTTKSFLFVHEADWRYYHCEAPTTVEKPFEDVTTGVILALKGLEKESGEKLLQNDIPCIPCYSTSSAGGGLAMVVMGLVRDVTTKSAERVALGAGSLILDYIALDDGRTPYKKIEALQKQRPDMVLLAGGFDGGAIFGPVFLAELINQSDLQPKLSSKTKLPIIYAGNVGAFDYVNEILEHKFKIHSVPNLRPESKRENLEPARNAIHDLFMDHVMSHAPGYGKYKQWISGSLLPTPGAVGKLLSLISKKLEATILSIDIGGATTDVFSVEDGNVVRTVSANLGMSYSILNVVKQGGLPSIKEQLDFEITDEELLNRIGNKYLNPTQLPGTIEDVKIECAVASVAIREAVKEHFRVKLGLSISRSGEQLTFSALSRRKDKEKQLNLPELMQDYDIIIGSGGILSHLPRDTAARILINALEPSGIVDIAVDSMFIFPHLGVLSEEHPELAMEIFEKYGWEKLGTLIAPSGETKLGMKVIEIKTSTKSAVKTTHEFEYGSFDTLNLEENEEIDIKIKTKKLRLKQNRLEIKNGKHKLIIDSRGRPIADKKTSFIPEGFQIVKRKITIEQEERIFKGDIVLNRELAIEGEVEVEIGGIVKPDTIIAKSTKMFLRPFFLDIPQRLRIEPEELSNYFKLGIGDKIEKDDLLAEKSYGLRAPVSYVAPVSGTVESILPNGTVIVREKPEFAGELSSIRVAKDLNIKPDQIKAFLRCEVGQEVEQGQSIAEYGFPPHRVSRSPIRGKIKSINSEYGVVIVESLLEELELDAWLPGKVIDVSTKGCLIQNKGYIIQGVWGVGGEIFGKLSFNDVQENGIILCDTADREFLLKLKDANVAGLITGGLNLKDVEDIKPSFTIVITERFGNYKIDSQLMNILKSYEGKTVMIDGTTELRVGVKRPRIILPDNDTEDL
ncbi:MAG: hypothetical protein GY855_12775 [candidate division Zixibacteria bacterium]|nr:hypothetical protein [candidate division Zixibacteria bacterium]